MSQLSGDKAKKNEKFLEFLESQFTPSGSELVLA